MLISFSAILLGLEKMLKDYDSLKTDTHIPIPDSYCNKYP